MAIRTVSNSGGNWNSVGTWVEGAVPTSADDVVFTSTSGNVTVNVTANAKSINFTNFVGTFTINNQSFYVYDNIVLVSGFTGAGNGRIVLISTTNDITITSNGVEWVWGFTTQMSGSARIILIDDLTIVGNITAVAGGGATFLGFKNIYIKSSSIAVSWTSTESTIIFIDTTSIGNGTQFRMDLVFDTTGIITIGTGFVFNNYGGSVRSITYINGTINNSGCRFGANGLGAIIDTDGIVWNGVTFNGITSTITLNSILRSTSINFGPMSIISFDGSHGFIVDVMTINNAHNTTHTYKSGNTYIINNSLIANSSPNNARLLIRSSIGGSPAYLKFDGYSGTCNIGYLNFTDIDASGGRTITTFNGVLSNTTNIKSFTDFDIIGL